MKTQEEIKAHLDRCMDGILARPKMWADTPLGVETQFLYMLHLSLFIDEDIEDHRLIARWCQWASKEIGARTGALTVASYLAREGRIDDDWKNLTDLLGRFRQEKGWVWSVERFLEQNADHIAALGFTKK